MKTRSRKLREQIRRNLKTASTYTQMDEVMK